MNGKNLRHQFLYGAIEYIKSHPGEDLVSLIDQYRCGKGLRRAFYATLTDAQKRKLFYEIRAKVEKQTEPD